MKRLKDLLEVKPPLVGGRLLVHVQGEGGEEFRLFTQADVDRLRELFAGKSHDAGDEYPDEANAIIERGEEVFPYILSTFGDAWGMSDPENG